jgi:dTDP-4-amino-4,6-dideoxygalactose transaminase
MVGAIGDATAFSFYATKNLTTGEGGMITTDNAVMADRMRVMRLHGISHDAWKRYSAEGSWYYEIVAPGYKYNMTDLAAALGLCQLAKLESMTQRRAAIAARYTDALCISDALETPGINSEGTHAWHLYVLRLHPARISISRDTFIERLADRNIGTSVHFIPLHLHPYYRQTYGYEPTDFPVAYAEYQRAISLPIYAAMSDDDVEEVITAVLDIVHQASR